MNSNNSKKEKYIVLLYNVTPREYVILYQLLPKDLFEIRDIQNNQNELKNIEKQLLFEKPDIVICDEKTDINNQIRDILYDAHCGVAKVTTKTLPTIAYTDPIFELTSENITVNEKRRGQWFEKPSTKINESLKKIVDIMQLSNIAKLQKQIKMTANHIRDKIDIDKEFHDGKSMTKVTKEYLYKLGSHLNSYIAFKDNYTAGHSNRVSKYAEALGKAMELNTDEMENLILAANLHDIGKISIPDAIITKTSKLDDFEFDIMQKHTTYGPSLLPEDLYGNIKSAIRGHHEKMNGTGYPDGLKGDEIPLFAKIIAIADSFDAMTSQRSYNKVKSAQDAFDDLKAHSNPQDFNNYWYDEKLVTLFIEAIKNNHDIMENLNKEQTIANARYEQMKKEEENNKKGL